MEGQKLETGYVGFPLKDKFSGRIHVIWCASVSSFHSSSRWRATGGAHFEPPGFSISIASQRDLFFFCQDVVCWLFFFFLFYLFSVVSLNSEFG